MTSFKNWPVKTTQVASPGACVAVGDCMGTAAYFPKMDRKPYSNELKDWERYGNEGFNLDPPRLDPLNGAVADKKGRIYWSALDDRHAGRSSILWVDGHATAGTLESLGYNVRQDGKLLSDVNGEGGGGNNRFFHIKGENEEWLAPPEHWGG